MNICFHLKSAYSINWKFKRWDQRKVWRNSIAIELMNAMLSDEQCEAHVWVSKLFVNRAFYCYVAAGHAFNSKLNQSTCACANFLHVFCEKIAYTCFVSSYIFWWREITSYVEGIFVTHYWCIRPNGDGLLKMFCTSCFVSHLSALIFSKCFDTN